MSFLGGLLSGVGSVLGPVISTVPIIGGLGDAMTNASNEYKEDKRVDEQRAFAIQQLEREQQFNAEQAQINRDFNSEQAQINRDYQTSERESVQQFNLDMWNLNNEYNSPVEQLKRAQAAGINPNAVLGSSVSGSVSGGAVRSSPMSGSAASGTPASSPGSIASTLLTSDAVVRNLMAQADKTETESDLNRYQLGYDIKTEPERIEALVNSNSESKARIVKLFSDVGVNDFNKELQTATFGWFARKSEQELKVMSEQLNELRNRALLLEKQAEGVEKDNTIKQTQIDFSNITDIPYGTPAEDALYKLWKAGKMQEFLDYSAITLSDKGDVMKGNLVGYGAQARLGMMFNDAYNKLSPVMNETHPPKSIGYPQPKRRFGKGKTAWQLTKERFGW